MPEQQTLRACIVFVSVALGVGVLAASVPSESQSASLAAIGRAVHGGVRIDSLDLEGHIIAGVNASTGRELTADSAALLHIEMIMPDRYRRTVEDAHTISTDGFAKGTPLFDVHYKPGTTGSARFNEATYLPKERAIFARLLLGGFGLTEAVFPVAVELQSDPHALRATGPDGFECSVELAADGTPTRLKYTDIVFFYTPPGPGETFATRRSERGDVTMTFGDRRLVNGVRVPFSIVTTAHSFSQGDSLKIEDIALTNARVNATLSATDFTKQP